LAAVVANPQAAADSLALSPAMEFGVRKRAGCQHAFGKPFEFGRVSPSQVGESVHASGVLEGFDLAFARRQLAHVITRFFGRGSSVAGDEGTRNEGAKECSHGAMLSNVARSQNKNCACILPPDRLKTCPKMRCERRKARDDDVGVRALRRGGGATICGASSIYGHVFSRQRPIAPCPYARTLGCNGRRPR
jgi:hypothetical protein